MSLPRGIIAIISSYISYKPIYLDGILPLGRQRSCIMKATKTLRYLLDFDYFFMGPNAYWKRGDYTRIILCVSENGAKWDIGERDEWMGIHSLKKHI